MKIGQRSILHRLEEANFKLQALIEKQAKSTWQENRALSKEIMTLFTMGTLSRAMEQADAIPCCFQIGN